MGNPHLAELFREIAVMMTVVGANVFKIRAHERAAQTLESTPEDLEKMSKEGRLGELPGIGEAFAEKIAAYFETGKLEGIEELRGQIPKGVMEIMRVPGVGPKKAMMLCQELKITSVEDLEKACRVEKVRPLAGMGQKSEEKILAGIASMKASRERTPLFEARDIAEVVVDWLKTKGGAKEAIPTGSLRRWKDTVRDVDVLAVSDDPARVMKAAAMIPQAREVIASGETKTSILYGQDRLQVDVRVVPKESLGAALQYFTGSKEHNLRLRERAARAGLTINEWGVFEVEKDGTKGKRVAGDTEESVYKVLGLPWIPPELREDRGEFEAAEKGLPRLIERRDIRGDLHTHTTWSDGTASTEEMARAAEKLGYEYLAITDHSPTAAYAGGLGPEKLKKQWDDIDRVQEKVKIRLLKGTEADILPDGSLDYPDAMLAKFEIVVASIHAIRGASLKPATDRLVRAIENPHVHIIGHASTRRLGQRAGLEIDWETVFAAAKEHGKAIELNSSPERLDMDDIRCARAKAVGIPIPIDTDAHSTGMFERIEYGIAQARRAWLEPKDVLNTRGLKELLKWLDAK